MNAAEAKQAADNAHIQTSQDYVRFKQQIDEAAYNKKYTVTVHFTPTYDKKYKEEVRNALKEEGFRTLELEKDTIEIYWNDI